MAQDNDDINDEELESLLESMEEEDLEKSSDESLEEVSNVDDENLEKELEEELEKEDEVSSEVESGTDGSSITSDTLKTNTDATTQDEIINDEDVENTVSIPELEVEKDSESDFTKGYINWNKPTKKIIGKRVNITFNGSAPPGTKIILYKKTLVSTPRMKQNIWTKKYRKINTIKLLKKIKPIFIKENGEFEISFNLPKYRYKIFVAFKTKNDKKQKNLIILDLANKKFKYFIELLESEKVDPLEEVKRKNYEKEIAKLKRIKLAHRHEIALGLGLSYILYDQKYETGQSNFSFSSNELPSIYAKIKMPMNNKWNFQFSWISTPGSAQVEDPLTIDGTGTYAWQTASVETFYVPKFLNFFFSSFHFTVEPYFGAHYQMIPFIAQDTVSNYIISKNKLYNLSFGIRLFFNSEYKNSFDLFLGYQYLAYETSIFNFSSNDILEYGVSWIYKFSETWAAHLSWHKRDHSYNFDYTNETLSEKTKGVQDLGGSDIQLKLSYQY